jgi:hypothetical protein
MQMETANSNTWSVSAVASWYGDEVRLERKEASGVAGVLDLLRSRTRGRYHRVRRS